MEASLHLTVSHKVILEQSVYLSEGFIIIELFTNGNIQYYQNIKIIQVAQFMEYTAPKVLSKAMMIDNYHKSEYQTTAQHFLSIFKRLI